MNEAASRAYAESKLNGLNISGSLQNAIIATEEAHANQLRVWGSLNDYVQAHAEFGTELSVFGSESLISFTTDLARAAHFAGPGGIIFSVNVPRSAVILQTLSGASEAEYLIPHLILGIHY